MAREESPIFNYTQVWCDLPGDPGASFCVGLLLAGEVPENAKVDVEKEHSWRHWEGHWKQRSQQQLGRREGGRSNMQQEQEAGVGAICICDAVLIKLVCSSSSIIPVLHANPMNSTQFSELRWSISNSKLTQSMSMLGMTLRAALRISWSRFST